MNDDYDIDLTQCRSYPQQVGPSGFNEMGPACYVKHPQTQEVYEETCAIYYCGRKFCDDKLLDQREINNALD